MKELVFNNWTFFRVLRLLAGIAIIVQAVLAKDTLFGLAGLMITAMAIFNASCCGVGGCNTPITKSTKPKKEIIYEEVA